MKEFFKDIASEEKENIDCNLLSRQILTPSRKTYSLLQKHGDLYNFWIVVLENKSSENAKLLQVGFLKNLMNGFEVYKKFKKSKKKLDYKAEDLYLILLANQNRTVKNIFLNTPTDKHNKKLYLQARILFDLRGKKFKKLFNEGIIKNDSDQSNIVRQKYEESIAEKTKSKPELKPKFKEFIVERTKLRRQRSAEQRNKQSYTTNMPNLESEESAAEQGKRNQQGKGLRILSPKQILSRLPISLAQLKAGNNSKKLKNEIRQLLHSLYRSKKLTKQIYKSLINIT